MKIKKSQLFIFKNYKQLWIDITKNKKFFKNKIWENILKPAHSSITKNILLNTNDNLEQETKIKKKLNQYESEIYNPTFNSITHFNEQIYTEISLIVFYDILSTDNQLNSSLEYKFNDIFNFIIYNKFDSFDLSTNHQGIILDSTPTILKNINFYKCFIFNKIIWLPDFLISN